MQGKNTVFYIQKNKAVSLLNASGIQFPGGKSVANGFNHSIYENSDFVNKKILTQTETKQFKRWFGDWQNNPKRASKVIDADGIPMFVYIGRNEGSTLGNGIYLTTSKELARGYGKNIYSLYAAIKNPFDMQKTGTLSRFYNELNEQYGLSGYYGADYAKGKLRGDNNDAFDLLRSLAKKNGVDVSDILQSLGFDGIHNGNAWVAYKDTQIKSATDNIGTFDGENTDISFSVGGDSDAKSDSDSATDSDSVSDTDKRFAPVESAIKLLKGGKALTQVVRDSGVSPRARESAPAGCFFYRIRHIFTWLQLFARDAVCLYFDTIRFKQFYQYNASYILLCLRQSKLHIIV